MLQKPPRMYSVISVSTPPARQMSMLPLATRSAATPMALAPVAQAAVTEKLVPSAPRSRAISKPGVSTSIAPCKCGPMRCGPFSNIVCMPASIVAAPPKALPTITPTRSGSSITAPLCAQASRAAATAVRLQRSSLRASFFSITDSGSKPFISQAIFVSMRSGSKPWIGATPDWPASSAFHEETVLRPTGDRIPMPVITTRDAPTPPIR